MGRPRKFPDRISTQIRLRPELHQRLHQAAEDRDVSVNYLMNRAAEEFLDRLIPADEWTLTRDRQSSRDKEQEVE